jgi:site-specific recombinase XerD
MRFTELEPEYLQYLATQRGCSPNTLRTYRSALARCREASAAVGSPEPDTESIDRRWANLLVQELGKRLRPRTVHRNITALRSMLAYAQEEGYTERNPLVGLRLPKKDAVQRTPVTTEDLNQLIDATDRLYNPVRAAMARALIITAATAATRYSDLLPLRVSDVDLDAGILLIRKGKGNKSRAIPLPKQTIDALAHWLEVRRKWLATWSEDAGAKGKTSVPRQEPDALWLADRGRPLGEDGLRRYLRELCLIAGIKRTLSLHDIRHSAATRMARQGMPLVGIQAVLGHTSLTTTQGYIAGAGPHLRDWAEKMSLPSTEGESNQEKPVEKEREARQRGQGSRLRRQVARPRNQ